MQAVMNSLEIESRDSVLRRLATTPLVTDDNMFPEWHPAVSE
jgi:hypothetical protein